MVRASNDECILALVDCCVRLERFDWAVCASGSCGVVLGRGFPRFSACWIPKKIKKLGISILYIQFAFGRRRRS